MAYHIWRGTASCIARVHCALSPNIADDVCTAPDIACFQEIMAQDGNRGAFSTPSRRASSRHPSRRFDPMRQTIHGYDSPLLPPSSPHVASRRPAFNTWHGDRPTEPGIHEAQQVPLAQTEPSRISLSRRHALTRVLWNCALCWHADRRPVNIQCRCRAGCRDTACTLGDVLDGLARC